MDTILMNSWNSETSDPHKLLLNLWEKINLKRSDKNISLSNFSIYYTWENIRRHSKIINLKYQLRHGMKSLKYLMGHILYQIFKIILRIFKKKKNGEETNNSSIRMYVSKVEDRITIKIKTGNYLELWTSKMMKLPGSTKSNINKVKIGENVPHLKIT